jgi:hypothetical protein
MKIIKNETTQGFEVYLNTTEGRKAVWLKPKQRIVVADSAISEQVVNLSQRKLLRISNA